MPHTTILPTLNPRTPKPPTCGLREEGTFLFIAPGILSWGRAGRGWTVKPLEAPPSVLDRGVVLKLPSTPSSLFVPKGDWTVFHCQCQRGDGVSGGEFSSTCYMIDSFLPSSAVPILFFCIFLGDLFSHPRTVLKC